MGHFIAGIKIPRPLDSLISVLRMWLSDQMKPQDFSLPLARNS